MTKLAIYPSIKLTGETEIQKNKSQTITLALTRNILLLFALMLLSQTLSFVTDIVLKVCSIYSLIIALEKTFLRSCLSLLKRI